MASATTRGLRSKSSRYSSPAAVVEKDQDSRSQEDARLQNGGAKSLFDRWLEPAVRTPVASFEDTKGLERLGVLEHMAPLGQPPTQKMIQKLKLSLNRQALRNTMGQHEEVATPSTDVDKMDVASPADIETRGGSLQPEELDTRERRARSRTKRHEQGDTSPRSRATPSPRKAMFSHSNSVSPKESSFTSPSLSAARLQAHFEGAINEAHRRGSPRLIPGLRKLQEATNISSELLPVLDAILQNQPTKSQFRIFKRYIKYGIKRHEHPDHEDLMEVDLQPRSPVAAQRENRVPAITSPAAPPIILTSPIRLKPSPTHRNHRRSPTKSAQTSPMGNNTEKMSASTPQTNGDRVETRDRSRRKRSRSASSSSSLSSAKSIEEPFTQQAAVSDEATQINGSRAGRSNGARQAANRVAAGNKTRNSATSHPSTHQPKHPLQDFQNTSQFTHKRNKKSREDLNIDHAEIEKRRREYESRNPQNYNDVVAPESHVREAVNGMQWPRPPLSRTVQAPVIHTHSLNSPSLGLFSPTSTKTLPEFHITNGTKRKRGQADNDADDADLPTPRSSSPVASLAPPPATSSRAATPRAARAAALALGKRKSARVLVS